MQWILNAIRPIIPTSQITDFRFVSIDEEKIDFSITIAVTNPSFLPIPLADIHYFFEIQNKRPVYGHLAGLKTLESRNSIALTAPISIIYNNIIDLFESVDPRSVVRYRARVDVVLKLPVIGRIVVPVERIGDFVMPFVPAIRLREIATVGEVSNDEVKVKVGFEVENGSEVGVKINGLDFGVLVERGEKKKVGFLKIEGGEVEIRERGSGFFRGCLEATFEQDLSYF